MDIIKITDPIPVDDSIESYGYSEYPPIAGANLNNSGGDIRIYIEFHDIFTHPSESYMYLLIEGRLPKAHGTAYTNADNVSLTNNAMMYLF